MRAGRVLIISENAPVPADRRVWNISRTLTAAGWQVVDRLRPGRRSRRRALRGARGHRDPPLPAAPAPAARSATRASTGRRCGASAGSCAGSRASARFDVVHACNPPDFLLLAARSLRRQGTRFVFDHHDLVPELYRSRFGRGEDLGYRATLRARARRLPDGRRRRWPPTSSYARVAIERGGMDPEDVFVVRNGPDLDALSPGRRPTPRGGAGAPT